MANDELILEVLYRIEKRLEGLERFLAEHGRLRRWLSMKEAAAYSGLSESTLRRAVTLGILRSSKKGGKLLFHKSWLDGFITFGKRHLSQREMHQLDKLE